MQIISEIKEAQEKQGVSETKLAALAGLKQKKVNNLLSGRTQKLDMDAVRKLQIALGIVSEQQEVYAGEGLHHQISYEENELLQYFRQLTAEQKENILQIVQGLILFGRK